MAIPLRAAEPGLRLRVGGGGQGAPRDSPTFFLCRALTTPIATAPAASTRARGTRVETSALEPPPCPAELEEALIELVPARDTGDPRRCWLVGYSQFFLPG